jgi:hypothetical protein
MKTRFKKILLMLSLPLFAIAFSCKDNPKPIDPEEGGGYEQGHEVSADTVPDTLNSNGTQTDPAAN